MSACLSVTAMTSVEHDVEGGDGDDQQQDQEHHVLLDRHGAEEVGVAARPVGDVGIGIERGAAVRARCAAPRTGRRP